MSTVKSKKLQVGTDATASNNFTIYQPSTPDGTLRVGVGNADSPTEIGRFDSNGYVATNAPAFSVTLGTSQTISNVTWTKVQLDTEEFDTSNDWDSVNYRFTPSIAGYYYVECHIRFSYSTMVQHNIGLWKNGGEYKTIVVVRGQSAPSEFGGSCLIYMNGTTDYIELYGYISGTGTLQFNSANAAARPRFSAFLARAA